MELPRRSLRLKRDNPAGYVRSHINFKGEIAMKTSFIPIILLFLAVAALMASCVAPANNELRPFAVQAVSVDVGVGSPIPVDIFVSGEWPDLCAQLAQSTFRRDGSKIELSLLATPLDPGCPPDFVGLPFRIAYPLNAVELPAGEYTITVNGVSTNFSWTAGK